MKSPAQIILEKSSEKAWWCIVEIGGVKIPTNQYSYSHAQQEGLARGYALGEANVVISARERFEDIRALASYIDAYRTTPLFDKSGLDGFNVADDDKAYATLARSVMGQDTVAAMICRGILDLGSEQRAELIRRLDDD